MERRDVLIQAPAAKAFLRFDRENAFLHDPDEPSIDPNELLRQLGSMTDPNAVNHNCPFCHETMSWPLFQAHAETCFRKWYKMLDPSKRRFAGAKLED